MVIEKRLDLPVIGPNGEVFLETYIPQIPISSDGKRSFLQELKTHKKIGLQQNQPIIHPSLDHGKKPLSALPALSIQKNPFYRFWRTGDQKNIFKKLPLSHAPFSHHHKGCIKPF